MKKTTKKEAVLKLTLNEGRQVFVYEEDEDVNFIKKSNVPFFDVEDQKNWKSYNTSNENPNLIGQIHLVDFGLGEHDKVAFHLCYNSNNRILTKNDLKAIIKGIDYIENFRKKKNEKI